MCGKHNSRLSFHPRHDRTRVTGITNYMLEVTWYQCTPFRGFDRTPQTTPGYGPVTGTRSRGHKKDVAVYNGYNYNTDFHTSKGTYYLQFQKSDQSELTSSLITAICAVSCPITAVRKADTLAIGAPKCSTWAKNCNSCFKRIWQGSENWKVRTKIVCYESDMYMYVSN